MGRAPPFAFQARLIAIGAYGRWDSPAFRGRGRGHDPDGVIWAWYPPRVS